MHSAPVPLNGWFRPWMPWVFAMLVAGAAFASALGATNNQVATNCVRIETIGAKVDDIAEDTAYTRGRIEAVLNEVD